MSTIAEKVRMYTFMRKQKKQLEIDMKKLGDEIKAYAEEHGTKDDKGSYIVDDGTFVYGKSTRKSMTLNKDRALQLVVDKGLADCVKVEQSLDENKFEAYVSDGTITLEELEGVSDTKITYATFVEEKEEMPEVQEAVVQTSIPRKKRLRAKGGK